MTRFDPLLGALTGACHGLTSGERHRDSGGPLEGRMFTGGAISLTFSAPLVWRLCGQSVGGQLEDGTYGSGTWRGPVEGLWVDGGWTVGGRWPPVRPSSASGWLLTKPKPRPDLSLSPAPLHLGLCLALSSTLVCIHSRPLVLAHPVPPYNTTIAHPIPTLVCSAHSILPLAASSNAARPFSKLPPTLRLVSARLPAQRLSTHG